MFSFLFKDNYKSNFSVKDLKGLTKIKIKIFCS